MIKRVFVALLVVQIVVAQPTFGLLDAGTDD